MDDDDIDDIPDGVNLSYVCLNVSEFIGKGEELITMKGQSKQTHSHCTRNAFTAISNSTFASRFAPSFASAHSYSAHASWKRPCMCRSMPLDVKKVADLYHHSLPSIQPPPRLPASPPASACAAPPPTVPRADTPVPGSGSRSSTAASPPIVNRDRHPHRRCSLHQAQHAHEFSLRLREPTQLVLQHTLLVHQHRIRGIPCHCRLDRTQRLPRLPHRAKLPRLQQSHHRLLR